MYQIYADDTLIYDSTIDDYKIGKGSISLETSKSGSFSFSLYPDHFYYDEFVRLKTVITVYKSGRIVFRGRILNDVTDYWNNKVITCEGELGFLQDSIIRPFSFTGTPRALFQQFINEHNNQVDSFKKFKIGTITVTDPNNYITRDNSAYESALTNLTGKLTGSTLGGYLFITHGDDGTDPIPTIHYLADFNNVATQTVEFGANLKNYTKTVKAESIATAIIPLGKEIDDGDSDTPNEKLTIKSVNGGKDYVYNAAGVALYGWIFKTVSWDDVEIASNLKSKAEEYLESVIQHSITIELNAIDLHLLDHSIESFNLCDYVRVISPPHNFDSMLVCNKMTIDLLKPSNDSLTLGTTYSTFTEMNSKLSNGLVTISNIQTSVNNVSSKVVNLDNKLTESNNSTSESLNNIDETIQKLTPESIGAAPAVYVYPSKNGGDCNDYTTDTRLFVMNMSNDPPQANYHGYLDVKRYGGTGFTPSNGLPIIRQRFEEYTGLFVAYRYSVDGGTTWSVWEYDNPPLVANVEYKTTERCNGKPIYKKLVMYTATAQVGSNSTTTVLNIPHGISSFGQAIRAEAFKGNYLFPMINTTGGTSHITTVDATNINIRLRNDYFGTGNLYVLLSYLKSS